MLRGGRRRCPRCARGRLFRGFYTLELRCSACGLDLAHVERDSWGFMYFSTAAITGVILVGMLLVTPASVRLGQVVVGATALVLMAGSLPFRKGAAIGLNYWFESRFGDLGDEAGG